jgi:3-oxoacyl-[acyl-carrier-protein] synthase II
VYGNRVVVTGLGAITPIGLNPDEYWRNLTAGVSGVDRIATFDPAGLPVQIAAEVKGFDAGDHMDRKAARRVARFAQLSIAAAGQALCHGSLTVNDSNAYDVGAIIATGGGGIGEVANETETLLTRGWERVGPMMVPLMIANMASCQVSMTYGIKGPVVTNTAACAAGVYSLFEALHFLRRGDAHAILAGGTESSIMPLAFISLARTGALSRRNNEPQKASRPFDKERDGFVFGEGAGVLLLETLDHARRRGARILAELAGASITGDAYHVSAPEPSGESARRAIGNAIRDAELQPEEIEYVCAHGTGTPLNDASETRALKMALGDHAYRIPVSSPKSMVGHLLGAAGAMSAVACVKALTEGVVPPTINLDAPDPECDLDYVPNTARSVPVRTAMLNGFGFGGQNSVAVLKRWDDAEY